MFTRPSLFVSVFYVVHFWFAPSGDVSDADIRRLVRCSSEARHSCHSLTLVEATEFPKGLVVKKVFLQFTRLVVDVWLYIVCGRVVYSGANVFFCSARRCLRIWCWATLQRCTSWTCWLQTPRDASIAALHCWVQFLGVCPSFLIKLRGLLSVNATVSSFKNQTQRRQTKLMFRCHSEN